MKAKVEFLWYKKGDELKEIDSKYFDLWKKQGFTEDSEGVVEAPVSEVPVVDGDINGDGVFDKKDKSLAGRVLAKGRKKSRK